MYVRELQARYRLRRLKGWAAPVAPVRSPKDAAALFSTLFRDETNEVGGILCLSSSQRVLAYHELSRGTVDATIMHPRDVFKAALLANASLVVLGHNHPSGDVAPSSDDRVVTGRIAAAGATLGVVLIDHVIVATDGQYFSFKEAGLL